MSHRLTLNVPDELYEPMMKAARQVKQPIEAWVLVRLGAQLRGASISEEGYTEAMDRLMRHAGTIHLGYPTEVDNERIDADLAREYDSSHEEDA